MALAWSFNANSTPSTGVNIYRSTSSGAEKLVATLPPWTTSWIDTGALTPGTVAPPAYAYQTVDLAEYAQGGIRTRPKAAY